MRVLVWFVLPLVRCSHARRVWSLVEEVAVGFSVGVVVGFFNGEQPVVQADFRCYSVWCADPVDGAFDFAVSAFHAGT